MPALIETPAGARLASQAWTLADGCQVLEYGFQRDDGAAVVAVVHRGQPVATAGCRIFRNPFANLRMAARVARQNFRAERRRRFREEARASRQLDALAAGRSEVERSQLLEMMLSCTSCTPELVEDLARIASSSIDELTSPSALYA